MRLVEVGSVWQQRPAWIPACWWRRSFGRIPPGSRERSAVPHGSRGDDRLNTVRTALTFLCSSE
eukprot:203668-Hanusia_phi.AAC.1